MRQSLATIIVETDGKGLIDITRRIESEVRSTGIDKGMLTLFCRHTSASLTIQENAAPEVRRDIVDWLDRIAPENGGWAHDCEGPDDMPAHIKTVVTGVSLNIPVANGRTLLGTWQGIYLIEHRTRPHRREIALHVIGE